MNPPSMHGFIFSHYTLLKDFSFITDRPLNITPTQEDKLTNNTRDKKAKVEIKLIEKQMNSLSNNI